MEFKKVGYSWRLFLSAPFIFSMIIPFVILDFFIEIYHRICFPLYRISYVKRSRYIRIDRHKLAYLNLLDKFYCVYCGYGNGLLHYASIIAGRTEKYWCGIRHKRSEDFVEPAHHKSFLEHGDEESLKSLLKK
ncbi:hypothetical protein ACFL16_01500 [Patescibacteria group bacterium]